MVACFSFEWFGSQIWSHRGVLTILVQVNWNYIVGSSHSSTPQTTNLQAVPENGSGSGLLPGSPLPGWFFSGSPDGTSSWHLFNYQFSLPRCAKNWVVKLYQSVCVGAGGRVYFSTKSRERERGKKNLMKSKCKIAESEELVVKHVACSKPSSWRQSGVPRGTSGCTLTRSMVAANPATGTSVGSNRTQAQEYSLLSLSS